MDMRQINLIVIYPNFTISCLYYRHQSLIIEVQLGYYPLIWMFNGRIQRL